MKIYDEVWARRYLTLENNKITMKNEEQQNIRQTWKTLFWEKGLLTKMVGNIMFIRQTNAYYMVLMLKLELYYNIL